MNELTSAQRVILLHHFEIEICPTCGHAKQRKWCFCKTCYFALKSGRPDLARGLWHSALDEKSDRFFDSYQAAKDFLSSTGLQRQRRETQGGLFHDAT